jgi:glycosyltransferase involved in cell wall biosynthesis
MPEYEFVLIAINPDSTRRGQYRYELPDNLVNIYELFLDEIQKKPGKWNRRIPLKKDEIKQLMNILVNKPVEWEVLFKAFSRPEFTGLNGTDILLSQIFYDLICLVYKEKYEQEPFTDIYWTMRSMYGLFFSLLLHQYPSADIYHPVSTGYAGLIGACCARRNHGALLVTEHGIYTREREEEIIMADWVQVNMKNMWIEYFYMLSRCSYENADQIVTLFDRNREIQIEIGCPPEKTIVIHNGINTDQYWEVAQSVEKRQNPKPVRVGAITRVVPIKDIITMLQAFAIVSNNLTDVEFLIMGPFEEDRQYYDECINYKNTLELNRVTFTGAVNIKEYLKNIDLLVLTSISEGQPLAILEGLACKIPFVTTNVGDCATIISGLNDDYGPAGFVYPIMDASGIAHGIIELCKNEKLRKSMGEAGYRRVSELYSYDSFIDGYRNIYEQLGRKG